MGKNQMWHPLGFGTWSPYFLIYVKDLSKIIKNPSKPILFADNIGVIVTNHSLTEYNSDMNLAFAKLNKWFNANSFILN
jgi:hypothetical protein